MTLTLTLGIWLLILLGGCLIGAAVVILWRVVKLKKDRKPLLVSMLIQHDDCSRVTGEYVEKHLAHATGQVIVWENGDEGGGVLKSESLSDEGAAKMLIAAANEIGRANGIKTAIIL